MKTKLKNMVRGKEIDMQSYLHIKICKIWVGENVYALKISCRGKRIVGKTNKGISVEKCNRFKKLKL